MNSRLYSKRLIVTLALLAGAACVGDASGTVSNANYTSAPPFVSSATTPNIIVLMDNSGSMSNRACESTSCGLLPDGSISTTTSFTNTTQYSGYFLPFLCYTYDSGENRFEPATAKATMATACSTTEWDGNFLNWATTRRFDAVKRAMIGGDCTQNRNADGTCPAWGSPSYKTVVAQATGVSVERADIFFNAGAGANTYVGRIPSADRTGDPSRISIGVVNAFFCVDNDTTVNYSTSSGGQCDDSYSVRRYNIRVALPEEPTGVIQQIGSKARFGLFEFKSSSEGARMLVGAGARQSIAWSGSTVRTFNTNTAAMVDAVQESYPSTWTPLGESLYDTARYVAQINSAFVTNAYVYPIAFSGGASNGVNFQANGVGSIGGSEISALGAGESCPSGYIANACGRDLYFFGKNHTPAWASTSQVVNCCKTYVILFTDGEPTQDQNIPAALQDYAHAHHGVHCTGTDTAAPPRPMDGTCNSHASTPFSEFLGEHKTDYTDNGSHYLDEVAYWAHTTDLRPCSGSGDGTIPVLNVTGHCLPGMQNLTVYTFFAFGNVNGRGILAQTAKLGGFEDANGDGIPQAGEWDQENNYTGAAVPDGIPDAYFESSNVDDLQDKLLATIASILRRSSSGSSVSVLATASTGEGALYQSYFYPSTIEPSTMADVKWTGYTQSLFIDTFGNLREDSDGNGKLTYKEDKVIKTRYETGTNLVRVDKFEDLNGDGLPDDKNSDGLIRYPEDCNPCDQLMADIKPIWEAGKQLALKDHSTRNIQTWVDNNHDGIVDAGEQMAFTTGNALALSPYLRATTVADATKTINFVRGCDRVACPDQLTTRDRRLQVPPASGTLKVWKLGDIIHSAPTVVAAPKDRYDIKYGDTSYAAYLAKYYNRRQVAYVGGNDGMLHAFNVGYYHVGDDPSTGSGAAPVIEHGYFTRTPTDNSGGALLGEELYGFIPYELLPQLEFLTKADYQHVYYVDLPVTVTDARIFTPDADHPNGWGTVLIGGFRLGGSCGACVAGTGAPPLSVNIGTLSYTFYSAYFALDVTNPEVAPKLLWSFSDASLGLTTSVPAIVRVNPTADTRVSNTNAKWYMVAGSGMTGYAGNATQAAKVFVVNLQTGPGTNNALVTTLPAGSWNSYLGDMVAIDKNLDFRHDAIYFGRVIDDGTPPWRGKIYRLTTASAAPFGGQTSPSAWGISSGGDRIPTEMLDTFPAGASPAKEMGPVATAPGLAIDDAANVWVFAGSGRYYSASDRTDQSTQHFVGLRDSVLNVGCSQTNATSCMENDLVDMSNTNVCIVGVGDCGTAGGTNQVSGGPGGVSTFSQLIGHIQSKDGWFVSLLEPANPPGQPNAYGIGERVVNPPTIFGGIVFFPTFTPANDVCGSSGSSKLFALFYKTGSAYQEWIIGTSASGANQNVNRSVSIGAGLAFGAVAHIGSGSDGSSPFQLLINMSQGNFASCTSCGNSGTDVNVAVDPRSRYFSWINR